MNNIPNRFPARLIDRYCDFFTPICEMMIQLEMEFDRGLDAERLAKAVDLALDAEPILGCRFVDSSYKPYFERLEPSNRIAFSLARSEGEYQSFKSSPMDYRKGPQANVCLWQSPGGDRLLLKVAHHVADAGGVKDIASILSDIYRNLLKDPDHRPSPNFREQRGLRQILRHVPLHAYPRIYLNSIQSQSRAFKRRTIQTLPSADGPRAPLTYVCCAIPSDRTSKVAQYGRSHNATLNDIFSAAALRAIAALGNSGGDSHSSLMTTVDLRRYIPCGKAQAVANLSESLVHWPDLGNELGADFATTLGKVARITRYGKTHWAGLTVVFEPFNIPMMLMPHSWGMKRYNEFAELSLKYHTASHTFTNTGPIEPESVNFDTTPTAACILPPSSHPLGPFIFSLSGYNGTLTLAAGAYPTQKETIGKFFDAVLKELPS